MKRSYTPWLPFLFLINYKLPVKAAKFVFPLFFFFGCINNLTAQQPTVLGTEVVNGVYATYDLNPVGVFKQIRLQATSGAASGARNWEFAIGTGAAPLYTTNWRPYTPGLTLAGYNTFIAPVSGTASALYNSISGGASGLMPAVTAGNYYTFNVTNNNAADNNMAVLETSFNPATFISTTQYPAAPTNTSGVTVNVTMSAAPNAGENVYLRYSTDNFTTSFFVQAAFTGATGRAAIPAFATGTVVRYYFFSAPAAAGLPTHTTADMLTLKLLNNGGANYQYTVAGAFLQYERNSFSSAYTAITTGGGATQIAGGTGTTDFSSTGGVSNTDDGAALIPLPFAFAFGGTGYAAGTNYVNIATNGFLSFITTNANANKLTSFANELIFSTGTIDNDIAGWWDDLIIDASAQVLYQTQGTAPNRTFTVQYGNVLTYATTSTSRINFQVILYESSHVIELRYGTATNAVHNTGESATLGVEWGSGGIGNFVDAVTGSRTLGCSMNNSEQFPTIHFRFIPVPVIPTAIPAGTYNAGSGQLYPSLSEAIADLNHRGVSGAVVINCTDATYGAATGNIFPLNFGVIAGVSATNTITVQGNGAAIRSAGVFLGNIITTNSGSAMGSASDLGIVQVAGTDYLTFRNFSISHTAAFPAGIVKPTRGLQVFNHNATDGATNNTFRDLTISLDRTLATQCFGIYQRQSAVTITSASGANSTNKYYNLTIQNVYSGIWLNGNASFLDQNTEVGVIAGGATVIGAATANDIGNGSTQTYGIRATNQNAVKIFNCEVRNVTTTSGSVLTDGIFLEFFSGANEIYNNKIHDIRSASASYGSNNVTGIRFNHNTTGTNSVRIYNNFIYAITSAYAGGLSASRQLRGIYSSGTGGSTSQTINVDFNSVRMDGSSSSNISSTCFEVATTGGPVINCRNNILSNFTAAQSAPAKHYCVVTTSGTALGGAGSVWNRNILYVANTTNGFTALNTSGPTDYATLANWQAHTALPDANSFGTNPQFISATDLHINTAAVSDAESGGSYFSGAITWVSNDIDAEIRHLVTPDVGADEYVGCSANALRWVGGTSSDWNVASNWCSNTVPVAASRVIITTGSPNPCVISTADAVALDVTIVSGATLGLTGAFNLSLSTGSVFTNNNNVGAFSATGTGAVIFLGAGTVGGTSATSFRNVTINGVLTASVVPTFTGNFQLNSGSSISAAPNYGAASILIYNTGATTTAGNEWVAGIAAGAGVPQHVQIGNGANTTVNFGASATFRQALGDILISAGTNNLTLSTAAGGNLQVGGNWTNNVGVAGFNGSPTTSRIVTFNGNTNAIIGGTGSTTFAHIAVNKGASILTTLDVNVAIAINPTNALVTNISNGLLRINATGSLTKSLWGGFSIAANGGINVNGGTFTLTGASVTNSGLFQVSSGTATIGNLNGAHSINYNTGSVITITGGILNIDGRISPVTAGVSTVTYTQSGGTVTVMRVSSASATAGFDIGAPGSVFQWSSGSIIIERVCAFASDFFINASTTSVTGGTLQIGNATTPAAQTIRISTNTPVFNLTTDNSSGNNPIAQLVTTNLTVNGTTTLANGTRIDINSLTLTQSGPVANNGGTYTGTTTSNLVINGSGSITGNYNFTTGAQNLGTILLNRNGVPATIGSDLTLNQNGSTIAVGSTLNNTAASILTITNGGITINGTMNIVGTFRINSGGFVNTGNSPTYASNSNLVYNTGGAYNRNLEWINNSGLGTPGYPHHVLVHGGTSLNFLNTTTTDIGCGGNLSIGSATTGTLILTDYLQPYDLFVRGNINIGSTAAGTLTMSNSIGCDLYLTGNWTRNANGIINFGGGNGRSVYLEGSTDATITATGGQYFPYIRMQKAVKATRVILEDHVSIGFEVTFTRGTLDLGTNNKFFSLLSNVNYDARVDVSDSTNMDFIYGADDINGQFIVQRYFPARRAWRLVNAPLKPGGGTHSISQAWQERGNGATGLDYTAANWAASRAADTASANFATQITGGTAANGFDVSPNNQSSLKFFSGAGVWSTPANTNITGVNSQEGWLLFVRGDRETYGEITNQFKAATITTLRPRGQIFLGQKTITASGMQAVGNPYASAVDYFTMTRTGAGWPANPTYYVWDPSLGGSNGVGAFVTLTWNGTNFTRTSPYGAGNYDDRFIPSGAAIMVDFPAGGGTLSMNEANKNTDSTTTAFRPVRQLMTVLQAKDADNSMYVADGALSLFGNGFNNDVDVDDARKLSNINENISLKRNNGYLSVERKKLNGDADTIFYFMTKLQKKNYQLRFIMDNMELPASTAAFLEDTYLKTATPVSIEGATEIGFAVTNEIASAAAERFRLLFRRSVRYTHITADILHSDIAVKWGVSDELNIEKYEIERSVNGSSYSVIATQLSNGNSTIPVAYSAIDISPAPGEYYYRIKSTSKNGIVTCSDVVKVKIVKSSPQLYVFPNPVAKNNIQLQLNNTIAGTYSAILIGNNGQVINNEIINHAGGTCTKTIQPKQHLISGTYQLKVTGPDKQVTVIKVIVAND